VFYGYRLLKDGAADNAPPNARWGGEFEEDQDDAVKADQAKQTQAHPQGKRPPVVRPAGGVRGNAYSPDQDGEGGLEGVEKEDLSVADLAANGGKLQPQDGPVFKRKKPSYPTTIGTDLDPSEEGE
jgi:hypothetical protein